MDSLFQSAKRILLLYVGNVVGWWFLTTLRVTVICKTLDGQQSCGLPSCYCYCYLLSVQWELDNVD